VAALRRGAAARSTAAGAAAASPFDAGSIGTPSLGRRPRSGRSGAHRRRPGDRRCLAAPRPPAAATRWPSTPSPGLAILAGAGLLAAVSLALGAPVQAAGAAAPAVRPGGVASALARRSTRLG
jgi:hypothetical protein